MPLCIGSSEEAERLSGLELSSGAWTILPSNRSSMLHRVLMRGELTMGLLMVPACALTNWHSTIFLPY
jgi:hypothetical protein